jgi:hypothetical protein
MGQTSDSLFSKSRFRFHFFYSLVDSILIEIQSLSTYLNTFFIIFPFLSLLFFLFSLCFHLKFPNKNRKFFNILTENMNPLEGNLTINKGNRMTE